MNKKIGNREYKSDVFSMLMEYGEYALDVYNALNRTDYTDPELVEIKTLEKGISLIIRNDAAFIIGTELNIYEHQSTYSKNMPLRSLIYFSEIIKSYLKDKDIYRRKLVSIPRPHFIVFYNGSDERPEVEVQRLSESYEHDEDIPIELKCTVYNINPDNNDNLKSESYVLNGYTIFVEKVKENIKIEDEEAILHAIEYCIENDILKAFFEANKDEVLKNMTLDMTFEAREKIIRRDEFEAGQIAGHAAGQAEKSEAIFLNMISNGYDISEAIKMTGISKERAEEIVRANQFIRLDMDKS